MLSTCELQDGLVFRFEGMMNTSRCAEIAAQVRSALAAPATAVLFDLEDVDFVSSAFLRLCIHAYQRAGDLGFQIINANPSVKRVFKIAGLDAMFKCD
jgi:anti-anti-sigma factor